MIKYIMGKIFGKCIVRCSDTDSRVFMEIIRTGGFTTDPVIREDEGYSVTVSESRISVFEQMANTAGIALDIKRLPGIPLLFHKYKKRPGIFIGALIFFLTIWYSGRIIWDFDVTGNKLVSDLEIISALEELGCGAGAYIPNIDFDLVQNDCLIDAENLAWVSVNMDGTLARVEVREKRAVSLEFTPIKGRFANIVAAEDGVIEQCRVKRGSAAVEIGDVVKKGELLISGVIDVKERDVRYEYAEGEVMAKVYRELESYVPYDRTVQVPTGEKKSEISIKIFGNVTNLSPKGRIDYELYGKILDEKRLSLPFGVTLPVWITSTVYSEMEEQTVSVSETKALQLAREDVAVKLKEMADELQVLSVEEECSTDDTGVTITLGIYGVTDISANYGFSTQDTDTEKEEGKTADEENHNS